MSDVDVAFRRGDLVRIEQEGFESGIRGVPTTENPYREMTWEHDVWENGWCSGVQLEVHRRSAYH